MQKFIYIIFILLISFFLNGCGRKQHNFLNFEKKKSTLKINRIILPTTKITSIECEKEEIKVFWKDINHEDLIGYNIYKFTKENFIPKKPLNREPLKNNFFISEESDSCFLVRGVFKIQNQISEGPSSNILCSK